MLSILLINKKQVSLHRIYTVSYLELLFYRIIIALFTSSIIELSIFVK